MIDGPRPPSGRAAARACRLLFLLPLLACLFGCTGARQAEEEDLCRIATLALLPKGTAVDFIPTDERTLPAAPESVVVSYTAHGLPPGSPPPLAGSEEAAPPEGDWTICRFEARSVLAPPLLVEVTTSRDGTIGPAVLFFLRTYALGQSTGLPQSFAPLSPLSLMLQQTVNGVREGALIALMAMGVSLVFGHLGRLHLALGDISAVAALSTLILTAFLTGAGALPLWLTLLLTAAAGVGIGALWALATGSGAFGRLWRTSGMAPLIASIGLSIALREGARLAQAQREPWLPAFLPPPLRVPLAGEITLPSAALLNLLAATLACLALGGLMRFSRFGRAARAIADDLPMAAFSGVRPARIRALIFGLGGACAGLAGALTLLSYGTMGSEGGLILGLKAMAAAFLGGIGSLSGAFLGGLAIGITASLWAAYFDPAYRDVAILGVLAALLILRPRGLAPDSGR